MIKIGSCEYGVWPEPKNRKDVSVFTGKIEMVKSKWGLAFSAVVSVIASLVMASGLCYFFGLVTTLDSR